MHTAIVADLVGPAAAPSDCAPGNAGELHAERPTICRNVEPLCCMMHGICTVQYGKACTACEQARVLWITSMPPVPCGAWCWPDARRVLVEKLPAHSPFVFGEMRSKGVASSCWASTLPRSVPTCAPLHGKRSKYLRFKPIGLRSFHDVMCPGLGGSVTER